MASQSNKVLCIVGTRPEAIKMAPVVLALRRIPSLEVRLLLSGQHRHLAAQALETFGLTGDEHLDSMRPNQTLTGLTGRLFLEMERVIEENRPAMIVAQGDTTTVMVAAMCCFYSAIPFAHVEAGLRTGDLRNPFPEEFNRIVAGRVAQLNFAPTVRAKQALLIEGIDASSVMVTGNTVIDALDLVLAKQGFGGANCVAQNASGRRSILLTIHRRENFGAPMEEICRGLLAVLDRFPDVDVRFPVHPNPNVRDVVERFLAGHPRIFRSEPLEYAELVAAMQAAHIVLTDSGGIQEEAPALGKPVLVLRVATERPEAVESGVAKLIGTSADALIANVSELLTNDAAYKAMARGVSPYGDGQAARRIATIIAAHIAGDAITVDEFDANQPAKLAAQ